jgi:hypothetical protein
METEDLVKHPALKNRMKWHHGFRQCDICKAKLMAYLEAGHTFDEVVAMLAERHPNIKNPRIFARNAIRETTGDGVFDDYILEHGLWTLRNPVLAPPEIHETLTRRWAELKVTGKELIEMDKKVSKALDKNDETAKLLIHVMKRSKDGSRSGKEGRYDRRKRDSEN